MLNMETGMSWDGPCVGGPMDGREGQSRYPKGFLLIDRPAGRCWLYDWDGERFVCRSADGAEYDAANGLRAGEEFTYDVRAWLDAEEHKAALAAADAEIAKLGQPEEEA